MKAPQKVWTLAVACALAPPFAAADDQPMIGAPAPGFSLESLAGETVSLADQRGKIVVLHFGAGW